MSTLADHFLSSIGDELYLITDMLKISRCFTLCSKFVWQYL